MARSKHTDPGRGYGGQRYPGTFLLALREAFSRLGWQARRWLGDAVDCTDAKGREQTMALENLFRRVRPLDRSTWSDALAEMLSQVPDEALVDPPKALSEVVDRLRVRLGRPMGPQD